MTDSTEAAVRGLGWWGRFMDYWLRGPMYRQHAQDAYDNGVVAAGEHYMPLLENRDERIRDAEEAIRTLVPWVNMIVRMTPDQVFAWNGTAQDDCARDLEKAIAALHGEPEQQP